MRRFVVISTTAITISLLTNGSTVLGVPTLAPDCTGGIAVPDAADNPGLVSDCETLLAVGDALAGTATLNWSSDIPINQWEGVTIGGAQYRTVAVHLAQRQLTGTIPPELGSLRTLERLNLSENQLTGTIPPELGNLPILERLNLFRNQLTGTIPSALGSLLSLELLEVSENRLNGEVPSELGGLPRLKQLNLSRNLLRRQLRD